MFPDDIAVRPFWHGCAGLKGLSETLIVGVQQGGKRGRGTTKSVVAIAVEIRQPKG